jgi:hypothetical protein
MFKRALLCLALALLCLPAWAARKLTVDELTTLLRTMQQQKKTDEDIAAALKQVQLTEDLTQAAMNALAHYVPGTQAAEQIYVLEARSAALPAPAADTPATPEPAPDALKAMLDKAAAYVANTYAQLPAIAATRTTLRFQDNVEPEPPAGTPADPDAVSTRQFVHYINSADSVITSEHGVEQLPSEKDKTLWGANRMIVLQAPDPSLAAVFPLAQAAGTLKWLRWETVNDKRLAVFSYHVPKKKSQLALNICCFPNQGSGNAQLFTAALPNVSGTNSVNQGTGSDWRNYKANGMPYHGEFFIDPENGTVMRMIVQPELRPSDIVDVADTRIDYGPVSMDSKTVILPIKTYVTTEALPYGTQAGKSNVRCTFFVSEYKGYRAANGSAQN